MAENSLPPLPSRHCYPLSLPLLWSPTHFFLFIFTFRTPTGGSYLPLPVLPVSLPLKDFLHYLCVCVCVSLSKRQMISWKLNPCWLGIFKRRRSCLKSHLAGQNMQNFKGLWIINLSIILCSINNFLLVPVLCLNWEIDFRRLVD